VSLRLDLLYFIGYDLDEPLPWHSTLSRTRQLLGEEVFRELFKQVLRQCVGQGMVKGRRPWLRCILAQYFLFLLIAFYRAI
jgi:IS5 family transposase